MDPSLIPTPSPEVKLECSPMDSLLSEPTGVYPSLFAGTAASVSSVPSTNDVASSMPLFLADGDNLPGMSHCDPFQSMTPRPEDGVSESETPSEVGDRHEQAAVEPGSSDKKPTKKRKSWGQVLPEPKTNLPPRKRAKTEDEKEQRRVERVLRNRRAAQSSRERKRLEVEALEKQNQDLKEELEKARREITMLHQGYQQLAHAQGKPVVIPTANAPVTLSQELFNTQPSAALDSFLASQNATATTINPVSLSPPLHPVSDESKLISTINGQEKTAESNQNLLAKTQPIQQQGDALDKAELSAAATDAGASVTSAPGPSPDTTQRPAATLCPDLQCLSAEEPRLWTVSQKPAPLAAALLSQMTLLLTLSSVVISACCRPLTQIAFSLKAGISIAPNPANLTSIIWLITTPSARSRRRTSTSTTTSTPMDTMCLPTANPVLPTPASSSLAWPVTTLRLELLRKILTCNPMLARPLKDATLRLLRSVCSEKRFSAARVGERARPDMMQAVQWSDAGIAPDGAWLNTATLPSQEVLLALLWALRVEERRQAVSTKVKSMASSATAKLHPRKMGGALVGERQ